VQIVDGFFFETWDMLNLELTSPPGGHGDDSTYSSDMDTNQDQDVVEDFARTLDRRKISKYVMVLLVYADYGFY
jgi:hypothetical protein